MKKTFFLCLCLCLCLPLSPAFAYKITGGELPFGASFHIGGVFGPGVGINFGGDVGINAGDFEVGIELEQLTTDHDFDVNINASRGGLFVRYPVFENLLVCGLSLGRAGFITSKDTAYKDLFSGESKPIAGETKLDATYIAGSLDIKAGEFILTPKVYVNYLADGALLEFDFNLGHKF